MLNKFHNQSKLGGLGKFLIALIPVIPVCNSLMSLIHLFLAFLVSIIFFRFSAVVMIIVFSVSMSIANIHDSRPYLYSLKIRLDFLFRAPFCFSFNPKNYSFRFLIFSHYLGP